MSEVATILDRCRAVGLTLRRDGDRIAIRPARACPGDLLADIRAHKPDLLELLGQGTTSPWYAVARQVLAGEFDGGHRSLLESVLIGLRSFEHPDCREAVARLEVLLGRRKGAKG